MNRNTSFHAAAAAPVPPFPAGSSLNDDAFRGERHPFPLEASGARQYLRPHRLAQATGDYRAAGYDHIQAIRDRLNAPPIHVRIGELVRDGFGRLFR